MLPDFLYRHFIPFDNLYEGGAFPNPRMVDLAPEPTRYAEANIRLTADPRTYLADLIKQGHLNMRMETWAVWSAQFGFQYRYPLLDRRILEFILGMPRHLFMADGSSRYLARQAIKDFVPEDFNKYDPANESLRSDSQLSCWRLLQKDLSEGVFEGESAWVDMEKLRETIGSAPKNVESDHIPTLAKIFAAVRVWKMEQRVMSR